MKPCTEYAALLDLFLDGELPAEQMAQVLQHTETCPACQAYLDAALAIRAEFPTEEAEPVPAGFTNRVMQDVRAGQKRRRAAWMRPAFTAIAACLALVVLMQGTHFLGMGGAYGARAETAMAAAAPAAIAPMAPVAPPVDTSPAEAAAEEDANTEACEPAAETRLESYTPALPTPSAGSAVKDMAASYFLFTSLTAEEVGHLLDDYTPEESEDGLLYIMGEKEFQELMAQLAQPNIVSLNPAADHQSCCILVTD